MKQQARIAALMLGFCAILAAGSSPAQDIPPGVARGKAVTLQWCGLCHVESGKPPANSDAPPFLDVVRRPGRDADYLARFLAEDHFPMTTYRLFDHEREDVLQYLLWLQSGASRQAGYSGRKLR